MRMSIVVTFRFEGIHCWPDAQDPVAYLSFPHRHVFHVEAVKDVTHAEREIEIIQFKHEMRKYCADVFQGPHTLSCETMALNLYTHFKLRTCRVLEDGENGALIEQDNLAVDLG